MTYRQNTPPGQLGEEQLVGRVQGDALQIVTLVRDHGPGVLHMLFDHWGPDHLRNVTIALAAAVDEQRTPQELWGWLGEKVTNRMSTTITSSQLWSHVDPHAFKDDQAGRRTFTEDTRHRMADRAAAANAARWGKAS